MSSRESKDFRLKLLKDPIDIFLLSRSFFSRSFFSRSFFLEAFTRKKNSLVTRHFLHFVFCTSLFLGNCKAFYAFLTMLSFYHKFAEYFFISLYMFIFSHCLNVLFRLVKSFHSGDIKADKQILKIISCPLQKMQSKDKCFYKDGCCCWIVNWHAEITASLCGSLPKTRTKMYFLNFTFCTKQLYCRNILANVIFQNVIFSCVHMWIKCEAWAPASSKSHNILTASKKKNFDEFFFRFFSDRRSATKQLSHLQSHVSFCARLRSTFVPIS